VVRHRRRDELQQHLTRSAVGTLIHYPTPPHLTPAYQGSPWRGRDLAVTEQVVGEILSLPMHPHLSEADAGRVAECVRRFGTAGRLAA
jgi:dTDP-4-amino-4,6-dideoxygalactose transaminase